MGFLLYSRPGCCLCDEMAAELAAIPAAREIALEVADVDADPALRARYGHKLPVLLLDGALVCHGRLDRQELAKALSCYRTPGRPV